LRSLDNGLILRPLIESDRENLLKHVSSVFADENLGTGIVLLTNQLLDYYPGFSLKDNFVVIDTKRDHQIVAWLCLLRKKCVFENAEMTYGQMDMVGTQLEYRDRGLIHQLSNELEKRAAELNIHFIVVLGIPYFYKTLGYEYAIALEKSIRFSKEDNAPLQIIEEETYVLEKVADKINFNAYLAIRAKRNTHLDLYQQMSEFSLPFYNIPDLRKSDEGRHFYLVKENEKIIGNFYLVNRFGYLRIRELFLENIAAIPTILRYTKELARKFDLPLAIQAPAQDELIPYLERLTGATLSEPYAWYVKIPSIKRFLTQITPVIEKRINKSSYKQYDGEIRINHYNGGITLIFQKGKLTTIEEINKKKIHSIDQSFDLYIPPNNLFQLLMGYKSINTLESGNFDIFCKEKKKKALLNTLFPLIKASLTPTI
jgi:predicted acetyltransferase